MKLSQAALIFAVTIFIGNEAVAAAPRGRPGPARPGTGVRANAAAAFNHVRTALITCAAADGLTQQQSCMQSVVNHLREASTLITTPASGALQAWCDGWNELGETIQECNQVREQLRNEQVRARMRSAQAPELVQEYQQKIDALGQPPGPATSATCRNQSRQLRTCLIEVRSAFAGAQPQQQQQQQQQQ